MHRTRHHASDEINVSFGYPIYGSERFTNSEKSYFQFKYLAISVQKLRCSFVLNRRKTGPHRSSFVQGSALSLPILKPTVKWAMPRADSLELDFRQPEAEPVISRSSQWHGVQVEFSRLPLTSEYEFNWNGSAHYLALHDLILADGEMHVDDVVPTPGGDLRNKMTFVSANCGLRGWAKPVARQNTFTVIYFDPTVLEQELQIEGSAATLRPHIYFNEPDLLSTMKKLEGVMSGADFSTSALYAETLGLVAALEMFRFQKTLETQKPRAGILTVAQQRLVRDYIEENLGADFGLDDLASVAGLSRYHFSRRFKTTFGVAPHRFVTERKIDRARHLLSQSHRSIAEIAALAGFNSVANFNRAFRELQGITPYVFRRTL